jgi:capsular polysaccharide transport system ATP-binding protein
MAFALTSRRSEAAGPNGRDFAVLDRVIVLTRPGATRPLLFGPVSCVLPTNRVMAVLGREQTGRTTLLRLLGGAARPDAGAVISGAKFSMILNSTGYLHGGMTGIENVAILARMYAMDPGRLTRLAVEIPFIDSALWYLPVGELEPAARRGLELGLAALLPYDCYLIDDLERAHEKVIGPTIKMLTDRNAGVLFSTYRARFALQYADCAAVIADCNLATFDTVKDAAAFYDS